MTRRDALARRRRTTTATSPSRTCRRCASPTVRRAQSERELPELPRGRAQPLQQRVRPAGLRRDDPDRRPRRWPTTSRRPCAAHRRTAKKLVQLVPGRAAAAAEGGGTRLSTRCRFTPDAARRRSLAIGGRRARCPTTPRRTCSRRCSGPATRPGEIVAGEGPRPGRATRAPWRRWWTRSWRRTPARWRSTGRQEAGVRLLRGPGDEGDEGEGQPRAGQRRAEGESSATERPERGARTPVAGGARPVSAPPLSYLWKAKVWVWTKPGVSSSDVVFVTTFPALMRIEIPPRSARPCGCERRPVTSSWSPPRRAEC